jgi:two-component system, OmpR family, alkaline phosphatase synthesis response regulator PhoP
VIGASVLLIEDDRELAEGLRDALDLEGYRSECVVDGPTGLREALRGVFDLVILDAMLPGLSGFDILKELRGRGIATPVLMLTARSEEVDKVRGLKLGADDYVTKPFGIMELFARIEAVLKRTRATAQVPARLEWRDVIVDFRAREAWMCKKPLRLTASEYAILEVLARQRGAAVSRTELLARIWGTHLDADVTTRTVDQHILSLRRKLGDRAATKRLIETVYGHGYRLSPEDK